MKTTTNSWCDTHAPLKTRKPLGLSSLKFILVFGLFTFLLNLNSNANHFRYGNVTWTRSGLTVTFKVTVSVNNLANYYTFPTGYVVGGTAVIGSANVTESFNYGDGTATQLVLPITITEINVVDGWFTGTRTLTHTYANNTARTAFLFGSGAKDVTLSNNAGLAYTVQTLVNFVPATPGSLLPNNSPVSTMPSKLYLSVGLSPATFYIAAFDPDGNSITYTLSTAAQMGSVSATQPATFSVNPTTGLASFLTLGRPIGSEWNASIRITDDNGAAITIDVVIEIVGQSTPPVFNHPPTPANATTFTVQWGTNISFNVQVQDNDPGDFVILTAPGLPLGASMAPALPQTGNPVSSTFSWTPGINALGGHVINFTATDGLNVQAFSSVNILVTSLPEFNGPTPALNSTTCLNPGDNYSSTIQAHSLDPLVTVSLTAASVPGTATLTPAIPTPAANVTSTSMAWTPTVSDWGNHVCSFTATDSHSLTSTHTFNLIVNSTPSFVSSPASVSICAGNQFSYTVIAADADVAFGDVLTINGVTIPAWLTLTPNGDGTATLSGTPGTGDAGINNVSLEVTDNHQACHGQVLQNFSITVLTSIDDFNVCTIDGCDNQLGAVYSAVDFDDHNVCTRDACDPILGPSNTLLSVDDNDVCTIDDCDPVSGPSHTSINVDDGNICTDDGCDAVSGPYHNPVIINVTATQASPISCYGGNTCIDVSAIGGTMPYIGTGQFCNQIAGINSFTVVDDHGCEGTSLPLTISQPTKLDLTPSANPTSCAVNNGSVSVAVGGGSPGYNYVWYNSANAVVGINSSVSGLGGGTYTVLVTDANGCTETTTAIVTVLGGVAPTPAAITGPPGVCKGQSATFCVAADPTVTSYTWTLPAGVTGSSTSNCITVSVSTKFKGGMMCVVANNPCGASGTTCRSLVMLTAKPLKPQPISGPSPVCAGTTNTYCIPTVPNTEYYNWTITGNGGSNPLTITSGQGTTCVVVNIPAGYTANQELHVKAVNCKGSSDDRKINLNVLRIPAMPGSITGPGSICKSQLGFYSIFSVNAATTYNWTVSGNVWIAGGQGTTNLALDYNTSTTSSAVISVTASNSCGTSAPRNKTVAINAACKTSDGVISGVTNNSMDVNVYPNPSNVEVNVDFNSALESNCKITIVDLTGKLVLSTEVKAVAGLNHQVINLANVAKGGYLLILNTTDEQVVSRLFVE